jgi:hypothetical protein
MSTESAGRPGRLHEVGFYRSDAEFGALIVPFVKEGVAAGQPVIGYDDRKATLLRLWLRDPSIGGGQVPDTALEDLEIGASEAVSAPVGGAVPR